jgi:GWxTD domain-containing protein
MRQLAAFLLILSFFSCVIPHDLNTRNMAAYYRPDEKAVSPPDFSFWMIDDSVVRVAVRINTEHMLFTRQMDNSFLAELGVHLAIMASYESTAILDSSSFTTAIRMDERGSYKTAQYDLNLSMPGDLLARITLTDNFKGSSEEFYYRFQATGNDSRYSYRVSTSHDEILFRDYITPNDTFTISHRDTSVHEFWCKFYKRDFPLPPPPFSFDNRSSFNYHPDSIFKISGAINFSEQGFYHIQNDTSGKDGLTLFCFPVGYPQVKSTQQMLDPLRYLTTRAEFNELDTAASLRQAIDRYWLERGNGNEDRARLLIRKYYGRVQLANRLFSSYTEGWKTDRGMIYVVLGPPNVIYRYSNSETWIYGTENSPTALNLLFVRVENPFTPNDFSLTRSPIYEPHWYRAADFWRQGRAYNSMY